MSAMSAGAPTQLCKGFVGTGRRLFRRSRLGDVNNQGYETFVPVVTVARPGRTCALRYTLSAVAHGQNALDLPGSLAFVLQSYYNPC